ncbi:SGNH/GDSL hydrolase family protein [Fundidesulfovibrio soli]|uniref:SGNH/GDSL hydrolase family protein n=1 Tax=Fundidesulfovibrio soli TaxID=2922716 RepID=UPI001FAE86D0|nr:SGNH/GDSL hydrolase family protein [Fundidesulfovibrio soli]
MFALVAGVLLIGLLEAGAYLVVGPVNVDVGGINKLMMMGGEAPLMQFVKDPVLGYRLANNKLDDPMFQDQWGQNYTRKKPEGVFRIICLGGSTTYGTCADPRTTYPALLESLFNKSLGESPRRFEVVNAGTMGYNSWHSMLRAAQELDAMQPDMYLLMDGLNDVITSMSASPDTQDQMERLTAQVNVGITGRTSWVSRLDGVLRKSALYRLMRRWSDSIKTARLENKGEAARKIASFGYEKNMSTFIQRAQEKGVGVMLVNYPWVVRPDENFEQLSNRIPYKLDRNYFPYFQAGREYISKVNADLGKSLGALVADPQPIIDDSLKTDRNVRRIFCDTVHFTHLGNFYIAATAFNILQQYAPLKNYLGEYPLKEPETRVLETMRAMDIHPHYAGGAIFPKPTEKPLDARIVDMRDIQVSPEADMPPWKVYSPSPGAGKGTLRVQVGKSAAFKRANDFNAIIYVRFSNPQEAAIIRFWDGTSTQINHPGGAGWSPISERYGLHIPDPGTGSGIMEIELHGLAQLWSREGELLFENPQGD